MRHRRPTRKEDALFPLRQNFDPGIEMEFNVVARGRSEEEKWNLNREGRGADRH